VTRSFDLGDLVVDLESEDEDWLIVVNPTETPASEYTVWETPEDDADICADYYNPEYPADDRIVEAVYFDESLDRLGPWDIDSLLGHYEEGTLKRYGIKTYGFPESRLEREELDGLR